MARGRLVSRTLGSSRKFAALQQTAGRLAEFAQTLYPLLVANSDDYGRMAGDAFTVKHAVFPTSKRKEAEFRDALVAMHNACLIALYEAEGQLIIQIQQFDEHQPGLSKRTKSRFPELPVNFTGAPGISNAIELNRTEFKGTEPNRTERKRKDQNLPPRVARRDARPVENLKPEEASDDVSPALCDQSGDPGEGTGDAGCGVESADQGPSPTIGVWVSAARVVVPSDECGPSGVREDARTEAVDLATLRSAADPDRIEAGKLEARAKRQAFRERAGGAPGSGGAHPLIETLRTSLKETRH
jgi:hypothetical protein